MEISEHELRRLVREVDDEHRAGMETLADDLAEIHLGSQPADPSRRTLMGRAALGGLAVALGGALLPIGELFGAGPAAADTAPPTDAQLVAYSETVELALVQSYNQASTINVIANPAIRTMLTTFAGHHQDHATAFAALAQKIGANAVHRPNPKLLSIATGQFQAARDQLRVLAIGGLLENAAAATYLQELATLKQVDAQQLAAAVMPVESQHCAAFGTAAGSPITDFIPAFLTPDAAIDPTKYTS